MATAANTELEAIKDKQRSTWGSGDYSMIGMTIHRIAEELVEAADLRAGSRVLDLATGSGNAAIAAARCFCEVVGVDYVPSLLERARERRSAERLDIEFVEGDVEALGFPDASFDAVLSVYGIMFAPDQQRAAAELLRVCRPGGTIALASWTPDGMIGELLRTVTRYVPPPPRLRPPTLWGNEAHVRELLGDGVQSLTARVRTHTFRFRSPEHYVDFFRAHYGPTERAFAALSEPQRDELAREIGALVRQHDRLGLDAGPVAARGEYLEVVAVRSSLT